MAEPTGGCSTQGALEREAPHVVSRIPLRATLAGAMLLGAVLVSGCSDSDAPTKAPPTTSAVDPKYGVLPTRVPDGMRVDLATTTATQYRTGYSSLHTDEQWMNEGRGRAVAILMEMDYTSLMFDIDASANTAVNGRPARVGEHDGRRYVLWHFCPASGCDHDFEAAVVGTGLRSDELLRIARDIEFEREQVRLGWLPDDLVERAAGWYAASGLQSTADGYGPIQTRVAFEQRDRALFESRIELITVPDPRQIHLVRFLVGGTDVTVRGARGVTGSMPSVDGSTGGMESYPLWAWVENGVLTIVQARGIDRAVVERLIDDLRPADAARWEELADAAAEIPRPPETRDALVTSGSFEHGSWTVTFGRFDSGGNTYYDLSDSVRNAEGHFGGGSGSTPIDKPWISFSNSEAGTLFYGVLPNDYSRVEITFSDGGVTTLAPSRQRGWPARPWGTFRVGRPLVVEATIWRGDAISHRLAYESTQIPRNASTQLTLEPVDARP